MDIGTFQRFDVDSLAVVVDIVVVVGSDRLVLESLVVGRLIADNLVGELAVDRPMVGFVVDSSVVDIPIVDSLMIVIAAAAAAALDRFDGDSLQFVGDFDNWQLVMVGDMMQKDWVQMDYSHRSDSDNEGGGMVVDTVTITHTKKRKRDV